MLFKNPIRSFLAAGAVIAIGMTFVTTPAWAPGPKKAGADFAEGDQTLPFVLNAPTVVRSVALTAPAPGVVIVNGTVTMLFGTAGGTVSCSLTTGLVVDAAAAVVQRIPGGVGGGTESVALTRGFEVGAGTTTFNLVCTELSGSVAAEDSILTALYVPRRF